ncbi:MAG: translation initiation factor eIF 4e-like domain-containing protein [Lentinula lateritia]|nr:MAG: translation initiation factor eIF 4e-like domain-containing protein [Lentinula lateritia]
MLGNCDDVEKSQGSQSFMEETRSSDFQFNESQTSSFSSSTPYVKYLPTIFSPSSHVPYITTTNNWITGNFNEYTASLSNVERFTRYWRPSFHLNYNQSQSRSGSDNSVLPTTKWIAVNRGLSSLESTSLPRIPELKAAFDALASVHHTNGHSTLTVSKLDNLAIKYNILSGKWLVFTSVNTVDKLWQDVVQMVCMYRQRGFAKVSVNQEEEVGKMNNSRVICVYVEDFTDLEEVRSLRDDLRTVVGVERKIPFKMDAYSHMGIYKGNKWGISPARWFE